MLGSSELKQKIRHQYVEHNSPPLFPLSTTSFPASLKQARYTFAEPLHFYDDQWPDNSSVDTSSIFGELRRDSESSYSTVQSSGEKSSSCGTLTPSPASFASTLPQTQCCAVSSLNNTSSHDHAGGPYRRRSELPPMHGGCTEWINEQPYPKNRRRASTGTCSDARTKYSISEVLKRNALLERNRVAACKSRLKKKNRVSDLEAKAASIAGRNSDLQATALSLKKELRKLRQELALHDCCSCQHVEGYLAREKAGGGIPAIDALALLTLRTNYRKAPAMGTETDCYEGMLREDYPSPDRGIVHSGQCRIIEHPRGPDIPIRRTKALKPAVSADG